MLGERGPVTLLTYPPLMSHVCSLCCADLVHLTTFQVLPITAYLLFVSHSVTDDDNNTLLHLCDPNVIVAVCGGMQAVKLCSDKFLTQTDLCEAHKTIVDVVDAICTTQQMEYHTIQLHFVAGLFCLPLGRVHVTHVGPWAGCPSQAGEAALHAISFVS